MRLVYSGILFLLCIVSTAFGAEQKAKMQFAPPPQLLQLVGEDVVGLPPALYPNFYAYDSDNPACGEYFKAPF